MTHPNKTYPSIFSEAPVETTQEERMATLRLISGRESFLVYKAAQHDADWIESALEVGLFNLAEEAKHRGSVYQSSSCVRSLLGSLRGYERDSCTQDPIYGELRERVMVTTLPSNEAFKDVIKRVGERLVEQHAEAADLLLASKQPVHIKNSKDAKHEISASLDTTFNWALGVACALDLPETVEKLARARPRSMKLMMDNKLLEQTLGNSQFQATPYAVALFFSNNGCMDALDRAGFDRRAIQKVRKVEMDALHMALSEQECYPSSMHKAWIDRLDPTNTQTFLQDIASSAISGDDCRNKEDGILRLMEWAQRTGKDDLIYKTGLGYKKEGDSLDLQPLRSMVEAGMNQALFKYLEHGFDPINTPIKGEYSMLALAELENKDLANIIRSFRARNTANAALNAIDGLAP